MSPRVLAAFVAVTAVYGDSKKLTFDQRVEIMRGLTAEYATVKSYLPKSKKALPFESSGTFDKAKWEEMGRALGPAARIGDRVQITHVDIDDDKIVLEINNGQKSGKKWTDRIEIGMGGGTRPISQPNTNAPAGTSIEVLFHKPLPLTLKAAEIKKMLAPVLDFDTRSATEHFVDTLPPETQKAIKEKRAIEGMDRDQVVLALGRPNRKSRETKEGIDYEDWVYGIPPGRVTFITFAGSKVVRVKDTYAQLGGSVAETPKVP
jgi:hypothetical protein